MAIATALALAGCSSIPDCTSPEAQALAVDIMAQTDQNKLIKALVAADPRSVVAQRMERFSPEMLAHYRELCERPGLVFEGDFTKGENETAPRCKTRIEQQMRQAATRAASMLASEYPALAEGLKDVDALMAGFSARLDEARLAARYTLADVRRTGTIERYGIASCAATLTLDFGAFGSTSLPVEYDVQTGEDGRLRGAVYGAVDAPPS